MKQQDIFYFTITGFVFTLGLVNGYINHLVVPFPYAYWGVEFLYWIVIPIAIITLALRFGNLQFDKIGVGRSIFGKQSITLIILCSLAFAPLSHWWYREMYVFFHRQFPSTPFFAYQMVLPQDPALRTIVSIYFSLSAGIVEELYYRGLFFRLANVLPRPMIFYFIASPIAFALVHWEGGMASVLSAYGYGLLMVTAFMVMRNLWPLIVGHVYTDYVWFS